MVFGSPQAPAVCQAAAQMVSVGRMTVLHPGIGPTATGSETELEIELPVEDTGEKKS